jgi:O-antigen/teichoic acid export membrane protein
VEKTGVLFLPVGAVASKTIFGRHRKESNMLWTIFVILLILWLAGLMTGYTLGGVIHALLVIAIVVLLIQFIQRRKQT